MKMLMLLLMILSSATTWAVRLEVEVAGMTCGMCVEAITKELEATEKAEKVSVSLEHKKAYFEEIKGKKISDVEVRAAIKKAGYEALKIYRK
jgi:copper chaperone CopZ